MQNDIDTLIVIDFETLGTDVETCPVMALGIVIGGIEGKMRSQKEFILPLAEQYNTDSVCDKDTVEWWSLPDKAALFQSYLYKCFANRGSMISCIKEINDFIFAFADISSSLVVANSPSFDCSIIKRLYKEAELNWPFTFRQEFDFRSARNLFKMAGIDIDVPATDAHNALADAQWEYKMTCKYINYLTRANNSNTAMKDPTSSDDDMPF